MPRVIRDEQIGDYTLTLFQRDEWERHFYETEYAVYFTDGDERRERVFSCDFGYGDDLEYINRKFDSIAKDARMLCEPEKV